MLIGRSKLSFLSGRWVEKNKIGVVVYVSVVNRKGVEEGVMEHPRKRSDIES